MIPLTVSAARNDKGGFTQWQLPKPEGYTFAPGQYAVITFKNSDKPKYLAIAAHSSEKELLFLSRDAVTTGDGLTLSEPQGKGFTSDFADKRPFLYLTHGTGISAIRPAMMERKHRGFSEDVLLYGIASASVEPELDCLAHDFGVKQLRAYSADEYKAYVQDRAHTLDVEHFGAVLLVGSKEMMASCREVLAAKGFPVERIFSNY
jgi:NAD(P)H-flavin reductase